ncbi:hypothetical protein LWI28_001575 [Acer negundo]|uniref:Gag protein n=1 Tax=Acer negundo TaxID=4023 RepID=A0AAD5IK33_ACENE|nr:hypothetical protein LWI28_001575 [Acer negundo]
MGFIDGRNPSLPAIIATNDVTLSNPAHYIWTRQDQLLLNAILGSISPSRIPFIASAKIAHDAWTALANTYAKPSRGHIMHLNSVLSNVTRVTQTITKYMQHVKSIPDELAMLDVLENFEDLIVKILNGLGDEFKDISSAARARDFAISFEEFHEKLINFEAVLKQETARNQKLPITTNYATKPFTDSKHNTSTRFNTSARLQNKNPNCNKQAES